MSALYEESISPLMQWQKRGLYRRMGREGDRPFGDCQVFQDSIVLVGSGVTNDFGDWSLEVRPALCFELYRVDWVSMVATPSSGPGETFPHKAPLIMTAWRMDGSDLILHASTRNGSGGPVPYLPFSWHAVVLHHPE